MVLVPEGAPAPIGVIKHDGNSGLGNPGLALLVHELLKIRSPNLLQIGDSQHEANRVQDVGLSRTVQPRDCVEVRIEALDHSPRRIRLEPFQAYLLDVHGSSNFPQRRWNEEKASAGFEMELGVLNFENENGGGFWQLQTLNTTKAGKSFRFGCLQN